MTSLDFDTFLATGAGHARLDILGLLPPGDLGDGDLLYPDEPSAAEVLRHSHGYLDAPEVLPAGSWERVDAPPSLDEVCVSFGTWPTVVLREPV